MLGKEYRKEVHNYQLDLKLRYYIISQIKKVNARFKELFKRKKQE